MKSVCARCGQPFETQRGWIAPLLGVVLDAGAAFVAFWYGEWVWGLCFLALVAWSARALFNVAPFAPQTVLCVKCSQNDKTDSQL